MKFLKYITIIALGGMLLWSCSDTFELDLRDDPNFPATDASNFEALYNSVQVNFAQFFNGGDPTHFSMNDFTMMLSRQRAFTSGVNYETSYTAQSFDNIWREAYRDFMPDANAIITEGDEKGFGIHGGSARVLKAYVMMTLVDMFGDVPYSEIGQGADNISPKSDSGADVYAAALVLLDEAITVLTDNTGAAPLADQFYDGDAGSWIKAANSLKLKAYVTTRLVDASAGSKAMAIIEGGDFISTAGESMAFKFGSSRQNPDSRHPFYAEHYETEDGDYMSNWFLWLLNEEKGLKDPRIRGYFYRQVPEIPLDDVNLFDCVFSPFPDASSTPDHYLSVDPNMPYCVGSLTDGYYGRDHGNGNGIPPDGAVRTQYGVYPAGGKWDNDTYRVTQNTGTDGGLGAGILPIIPHFFVDFYRAELALEAGTGEDARALMLAGIENSIDYVLNFAQEVDAGSFSEQIGVNPVDNSPILGSATLPDTTAVDNYMMAVMANYDSAADPMDVLAKEFLIASYGNGIEGYNLYRRTGYPSNIQPMIQPSAGEFIRSALYPSVYVNLNKNATQKSQTDQVFWDNNPPGFIN